MLLDLVLPAGALPEGAVPVEGLLGRVEAGEDGQLARVQEDLLVNLRQVTITWRV